MSLKYASINGEIHFEPKKGPKRAEKGQKRADFEGFSFPFLYHCTYLSHFCLVVKRTTKKVILL